EREPTGEAREPAILSDHAVARNDDREGVSADRLADGSRSLPAEPQRLGDLTVGAELAEGDLAERSPDARLKLAARSCRGQARSDLEIVGAFSTAKPLPQIEVERHIELAAIAGDVLRELVLGPAKSSRGIGPFPGDPHERVSPLRGR